MATTIQTNKLDHPSFWTKYLEGVSCTFPKIVHPSTAKEPLPRTIHTLQFNLSRSIQDHEVDITGLHLAAWSALLALYIGAEQVCFGAVVQEPPSTPATNADASDRSSLSFTACRTLIEKETKPSAALLDCRASLETCLPHSCSSVSELFQQIGDQPQFNTAVCFFGPEGDVVVDLEEFELALIVRKSISSGQESCYLRFSSSHLSDSAAALVVANYQAIASQLVSSLDSPLGSLGLVSSEDLEKTKSWNRVCPAPVNSLIHDYFRRNVLSCPNALAVCASDASFTYQEIDVVSNILANFLVEKGVGPETVVPLCFNKSAWATVAILAVTKAGGAFTFLDPSFPINTLQDIVRQTGASFMLCSASTLSRWDGLFPAFEVSPEVITALPQLHGAPHSPVRPSNLLYIVFTSGSTGKPKGVCIEHSGFLSTALDFIRATGMGSSSRVLHFASYSFDASIFENLTALLCGGCVCTPDEASRDKGVAYFIDELSVNWAFFTPSLIKSVKPEDVPSLDTLVLMGEAPTDADMERWSSKVRLMNAYGPSECCVASSVHPSPQTYTEAANIGWPVGGLLWVVDPKNHHQLVPVGAVGELVIEGPHLGRGYLNNGVETAKAFIDSAAWMADFPASRSRRAYLTGDIVRRNLDGSVVFIGRRDAQVKVRGVRIELGAVEQHLSTEPLVKLATAVTVADVAGKSRLTAVVSIDGMTSVESDGNLKAFKFVNPGPKLDHMRQSIREIRDGLRQKVPGYMVPSAWFVLESFPLMPSGKVDRGKIKEWIEGMDAKALDENEGLPDQDTTDQVTTEVPLSPLVEVLRREIGLVLNRPFDSVAPWKSFINLGGDSISVLQLISQCRAQNMILGAHDVLQSKSIVKLASCVKSPSRHTEVLQLKDKDFFDIPFDLSPIQQLYFQWEPEGGRIGGDNRFNQSFLLRVKRPVSLSAIAAALEIVAERHPMLRCRFAKSSTSPIHGPEWQQIIPKGIQHSFRLEEHRVSEHDEIQAIILGSQCAIDIIRGPVFIVDLINESRGQLLSMIAHHAVIDLVSWRVIMRELELLLQRGEGVIMQPQRSLPWPAWCKLQAEYYASQDLSPRTIFPNKRVHSDVEYWWMSSDENKFKDIIRETIQLDSATTCLLMEPQLHQVMRTEPIDLFLSAIMHSFTQTFADREAPAIFRESHGREPWNDSIDVTSTVGWFTTMYPVQIEEGNRGLTSTLRRIKDAQRRVSRNGWPYFVSRFHCPDGINELTGLEILFDFFGLYQQLERSEGLFEQESWENLDVGPEFHRPALFEINAEIIRGQLQLKFEYSKNMKHQSGITRWIQECEKDLSRIVSELGAMETEARRIYTLSDFPFLQMGYEGLDNLFDTVLPRLGVSVANVEDVYDTSPMQTGILLSQVKDHRLYQCSTVFQVERKSLSGSIDVQRLSDTWLGLVQRHSSLRTIFVPDVSDEGAFYQVLIKTANPRVVKIACKVSELDAILKEPSHLPLYDGLPPHELTICEVDDGRTYIRIDINHACIDGASGDILVKDFVSLYDGNLQLPEAPVYRDFVSLVQGRDLEKELQYWMGRLDGVEPCYLPVLDDGVTQDGSLQMIRAKPLISINSLSSFCQSHDVTLPTAFKLAWALVLRAYTGSEMVCFGYLVSGRDNLDADGYMKDNAFGPFANILTCRCDLSAATLASLLNGIQEDSLSDLQHQYASLAHIQQSLGSGKLADQQPLFNTILNFQIHPTNTVSDSSIELLEVSLYEPTEYSCVVDIAITGECFEISLAHWTSLLSRGQAENITEAFVTALSAIAQSSMTLPAKEMNLFGEGHGKQIWTLNRTVPPRVDMCIHDIISHNAAIYPSDSAIESWDGTFTYGQLDETTTQLARHLSHLGVGAGSIVPLCFEKSAWTIVSLVAVLKAGGAFVLLDPKHVSADRTLGIIRDTRSKLLLASKNGSVLLATTLTATATLDVLIVDNDCMLQIGQCSVCTRRPQERQESLNDPKPGTISSRSPAYIFFTSGTTGTPKGSVNTHSSFCTAAINYWKRAGVSRSSRVLQYASYTFDVCLSEILSVLLLGGCVCVPTEQRRLDHLAEVINEARVNVALLTPSVARLITPADVPTLETLALCGEAVSQADAARWRGHVKLVNSYGPSECSVVTTVNECVLDDPTNIGTPPSSLCWIVDPEDHERLVPFGAIGELIIEGHIVSNGYFNNESKTAEAFVKLPRWLIGQRLDTCQVTDRVYKTGDLVRHNSNGSIQFIGRKDTQSKLHGQRIELGEIEQHLLSRSSVMKTVAVQVIEPVARGSSQILAAFFTLATIKNKHATKDYDEDGVFLKLTNDLAVQLQALQDSLTNVLPSYMIPTLFIPLLALPLSPSGKLDRRAILRAASKLPAIQLYQYSLAEVATLQAPRSEAERILQKAWVDVLGAPPEMIGRETSFFRLGGDSLTAMRLVSTVRNIYGFILTVADIFQRPRLCDMATRIQYRDQKSEALLSEPVIKPFELLPRDKLIEELVSLSAEQCQVQQESILDIYPCTPLQEGLMTISVEKKGAYLKQSIYLLPKTLNIDRLKRAWEIVVAGHPILRTRIVNIETVGCLQVVLDDSVTWMHLKCSKEQYLDDDMDIAVTWGAPLNRFAILAPTDAGDENVYLVWTAHHALFDEWSLELTMKQLEKAYHQEKLPSILPFNRFIAYIANSDDAACAAFWAAQLGGETPAVFPQLPPNAYVPRIVGCHEHVIDLVNETRSHITTSTIIRAAWALVTGRYANAEHIVFGVSLSGRSADLHGIDRINGPTMATVPVKAYLRPELPISDFLENTQAQAAKAIAFEHWGLQNMARVSKNVAFQNLLVVHLPGGDESISPLGLSMIESANADYHMYPLVIECFLKDNGRQIMVKISYDERVVPYAPRLSSHFGWLVQQLIARVDDDSPLCTLDFCSPEDKACIFGWNRESPRVVEECIHELVSNNAKRHPDALAVCSWDFNMTYNELDVMSTKLARHMIFLGVKPKQIVPAIVEKSAWAIVAQFAIFKTGGVICMLDPAHPRHRLEDHISTTDATFILASETYSNLLQRDGRLILPISASTMQFITESHCVPALPVVRPENAAYVVFTSGTTGRPKAIITDHRAFVSSSASCAIKMQISETSRVLQHTAFSSSLYIIETFSTLIQGGCVCIAKDETRTDLVGLADAMRTLQVTCIMMTPSTACLLPKANIPTLKTLWVSREPITQLDRLCSENVGLMNVYGSAECSIASILNDNVTLQSDRTVIGEPIGSRCWIVEPHDHNLLAPLGCVGELLLESPGIARSYLNEPAKTAEVFIHGPAWLHDLRPNSHMYKTGDLVRYNPADGTISFVGRKDMQVKFRGQRLDMEEIEHHLMTHELVSIATVTQPKAGRFKGNLVATLSLSFMSTTGGEAGDGSAEFKLVDSSDKIIAAQQLSDIKARLESKVPPYMVPSVWAAVYHVPLKVGKREIATWLETMSEESASEIRDLTNSEEYVSTTNLEMERRLREIVAKVLGLLPEHVLLRRSFISLGGDSITAIQTVARCRAENITVKTKDILRSKSIHELAERATVIDEEEKDFTKSTITLESASTHFSLAPIQKFYLDSGVGQMFAQSSLMESSHFSQSMLMRLTRDITVQELSSAVGAVLEQHGMLRVRFTQNELDATCTQHILPATEAGSVFRHQNLASQSEMKSAIDASQNRLDAVKGAVFFADSFSLSPHPGEGQKPEQFLFMTAHHLVIDLVSWRIIVRDLEEFLDTGKLLSKGTVSFRLWVEMQERYAAQNLQASTNLTNLFSVPKADFLYWGIPPDTNMFGETQNVKFTLDAGSTRALLGFSNECFGPKPDDIFLSALIASFATVFADRDMPPVYCEGHSRECAWDSSIDLSSTVGSFTTFYPLHVQLESVQGTGILDIIRRTKDARARLSGQVWQYFASRFLTKDGHADFEDHWPMEIIFNYVSGHLKLERDDALLVPIPNLGHSPSLDHEHHSTIPITTNISPQCRRSALFDIRVEIGSDDRATFNFAFNRRTLHAAKIQLWISKYRMLLLEAVNQLGAMSPEPTLSDFPLMTHLTYSLLERIKSEIAPALGLSSISDIADMYPCGPTQKGILISQARSTGTYNESFLYAISSNRPEPVNLKRLEMAWRTVVARHDALRTVFIEDTLATGEGYYQVVLRHWFPRTRRIENTSFDGNDSDSLERMRKLSATTAVAASDMRKIEPAHSILFCRTATNVYMYLEISHALIDAPSTSILLNDIAMAYDGNRLELPGETGPPSYRDYIAHVQSQPMGASIDYWTEYLDGVEPCHIPVLREAGGDSLQDRGALNAPGVQSVPIELGASSESIVNFCLRHDLTPASIFRVAWALVLRAYTGMDRVCFGYLASGRDTPIQGIENIFGLVCNMLVFRMHLDRDKTGLELLMDAQDDWSSSIEHQFVSLAAVEHHHYQNRAGASASTTSKRHEALFNTGVSLIGRNSGPRWNGAKDSEASITFDSLGGDEDSEQNAAVHIWPTADDSGFRGAYTYKNSHMTKVQARCLTKTYVKAIECIMEMSSRRLHEWSLVSEDDVTSSKDNSTALSAAATVSRLATNINPTSGGICADDVISSFAQKDPNRPAVCSWDGELTYQELEVLTSRLAHHLATQHNVGPDVLVPVCMDKSIWFVVSILAVLKAGGAFVPMDATQPGRFQAILEQTNAQLVLTSESLREHMSHQSTQVTALVVDGQLMQRLPLDSSHTVHRLRQGRHDRNAAYVMFTSGSTGTPKGVVIEHRAWCATVVGWIEASYINEQTRKLQYASYSFDAALADILGSLMAGGCVCIPSEAERLDNIEGAITRMQVNSLNAPPSLIRMLNHRNIPSIRTIIVGGESMPEHEIHRWCGKVKLIFAYGPTECSVESSSVICSSANPLRPSNIGFPKRTSMHWVVSATDHNVLVPAGSIGELLIEGVSSTPHMPFSLPNY